MKQIKIIIVLLIVSSVCLGQHLNDNVYKAIKQYFQYADSMPDYTNPRIIITNFESKAYFDRSAPFLEISENDLDRIDEIIEWVNNYAHSTLNVNERTLAFYFFDALMQRESSESETLKLPMLTKQKLINYILGLSQTINYNAFSMMSHYSKPEYFNEASKKRIMQLLHNDLPPAEKDVIIKRRAADLAKVHIDTTNYSIIRQYNHDITNKGEDYPSMAEWIEERNAHVLNRFIDNYSSINSSLIYFIGNAYLYEFTDKLEEMYNNDKHESLRSAIELVFARLQYKDYEDIVLDRLKNDFNYYERHLPVLERQIFGVFTNKAIAVYAEMLKSELESTCYPNSHTSGPIKYQYFISLSYIIKNYPYRKLIEEIAVEEEIPIHSGGVLTVLKSFCDIIDLVPDSTLSETYNWIQDNLDNLELNPRYLKTL